MSRQLPEIPEFSPLPKLKRRNNAKRLVQLMLEIRNLDLITLPSPAQSLPLSLTPSIHFVSFLPGAGVVSVWSHMPADCRGKCPQCPQQSTRNPGHYMK